MSEPGQVSPRLSWDGWLRFFIIGYFLGGILGLWSLWLKETLAPGGLPTTPAVLWATVCAPLLSLGLGYWRLKRGRYRLFQRPTTTPYIKSP